MHGNGEDVVVVQFGQGGAGMEGRLSVRDITFRSRSGLRLHRAACLGIRCTKRLVHEQHFGIARQRAGDGGANDVRLTWAEDLDISLCLLNNRLRR